MLKKFIGEVIGTIGAHLWQNGGWTGDERYEDLTVSGKIGYRMFCAGLKLMDITPEDLEAYTKNL